jgi:two-component sensor histidine kinase/CheY-like chemotaxis protein
MDITQRKRTEERQTYLAREVDHRARNVLAVVQSMLRLTKASTTEEYVTAVEGRISALSRAHTLLSESRWQGADLKRLVHEELEPYRGEANGITATGPSVLLDSRRAQTMALAVHELATNAAKHGALAHRSGAIDIEWARDKVGLTLRWSEAGIAVVAPPKSRGYGMRVIGASIEQLGGAAVFDWHANGLRCVLSLPLAHHAPSAAAATAKIARPKQVVPNRSDSNAVLLVEDESLVALMMAESLAEMGFEIVGPFANSSDAMGAVATKPICAAVLDINLGKDSVYPVADLLVARGVPFAFVTGYGSDSLDRHYPNAPVLMKPIDRDALMSLFVRPATY